MKILWAFLALCLFSGFATAQSGKEVSAIRKEVESINKNSASLNQTTVKLDNISTEGAELTVYRDKNQIKKIVAEIRGEMGYSNLQLYYKDEKLIFVYEREFRYERPLGRVLKIIPTRFYFADEKLVKMFYAKRELSSGDKDYNEMRDRMLSLSKTVFDAAKNKAKSS